MPRLSYLALFLALFALLPTFTFAQTAAPTKDTVLFDFESGTFDGWTLSGDCWDKQPATPKTFVDKAGRSAVSGIVGCPPQVESRSIDGFFIGDQVVTLKDERQCEQ